MKQNRAVSLLTNASNLFESEEEAIKFLCSVCDQQLLQLIQWAREAPIFLHLKVGYDTILLKEIFNRNSRKDYFISQEILPKRIFENSFK